MLYGLRTVVYRVDDLARARAFYADLLGHTPYFDEPFYVGFDVGGYELGLRPREAGEASGAGGDVPYFAVEDVDNAIEAATGLGAEPYEAAQEVGGGIVVGAVRDPSGNVLGFIHNPHFAVPAKGAVTVDGGTRIAATGELDGDEIVVERTVGLPPSEVWPLWTTTEGLLSWFAPEGEVELAIGGKFHVLFLLDNPEGERGSEGCRILAWDRERMLAFTWNAPPHLATRDDRTQVVLTFEPAGAGTRVRLVHHGFPSTGLADPTTDWPATFEYFASAWARVLDGLAAHCER